MNEKEKTFHQLMDVIYETSRLVSTYESIPRKYGTEDFLYMVEVHTLDLIGKKGKTTTSELSQITNRTLSAISQTIDKLIQKNLVTRVQNPNNKREYIIQLTEKGQNVFHFHEELDRDQYQNLLGNLGEFTEADYWKTMLMLQQLNEQIRRNQKTSE